MSVWVEAARPKTLPAAVAPVLVGTAVASTFVAWRFVAALVVSLALQVAVNYANDYFDGIAGIDTAARVGPRRAVASGLVPPAAMKRATGVALAVAGVAGLALAIAAGFQLLLVGAAAVLATLGYSGGSRPYASRGLGEVFVFVFFGLVATVGSQYVQDEVWSWAAVLVALPVGLITTAILVVNNLRDIPTDRETGKHTLAVRLGESGTRTFFQVLVWSAFALLVPIAVVTTPWALLALGAGTFALGATRIVRHAPLGPRLIGALELTGRLDLGFGVLLALGLVVARVTG